VRTCADISETIARLFGESNARSKKWGAAMSYSEKDGQRVGYFRKPRRISKGSVKAFRIIERLAAGDTQSDIARDEAVSKQRISEIKNRCDRGYYSDRLNSGNPNYTPYQTGKSK